ncbi:MAG: hypothetical protein QM778_23025 [Myxococcales bacterium]
MSRTFFLSSTLSFALAASFALGSGALADPATFTPTPWVGSYAAAAPDQAKSTIDKAIDDGTSSMGMMRRNAARTRLKNTNRPYKQVTITPLGTELVTNFDGRKYQAPTNGAAEKGKDPDGKTVSLSYKAEGETLKSTYVGEDGEKHIDFERTPDGDGLIMHVTVMSKKLPEPIKYSVRYKKR